MTRTPADIGLSPPAAARFDDYLSQVRAALARVPDVNPDEIEADIREHVEHELLGAARPVPLAALAAVLARLGPPSQWGAGDDPTLLHRARHLLGGARAAAAARLRGVRAVLWGGPEDWRLTYLSFGAFALVVLSFGVLLPVCLPLSYLLARAGVAHARDTGVALGARRWLLYPPVVLVSLTLLTAAVAWPAGLGGVAGEQVAQARDRVSRYDRHLRGANDRAADIEWNRRMLAAIPGGPAFAPAAAGLFVGAGALLLWWAILGAAAARFPGAVRAAFCPLCDRFESRNGGWLAFTCSVLLIPWCATAYEVVAALV
jgi:hypothetical protein